MKICSRLLVLMLASVTVVGCAKNNAPASKGALNTPAGDVGGRNTNISNGVNGQISAATCVNTIPLEGTGLKPITSKEEIPEGTFILSEITMHKIENSNHDTFTAVTRSSSNFDVELSCNGVNARPGSETNETFRISDSIDIGREGQSSTQRYLEIKFKDGKLDSALSYTKQAIVSRNQLASIPQERIRVGNDVYITLRLYNVDEQTLELRMKMEYPAIEDGTRSITFTRTVYKKN